MWRRVTFSISAVRLGGVREAPFFAVASSHVRLSMS